MIDLKPVPGLTFLSEENGKPCHKHMLNGREIPGCTSISSLFQDDGWKFAWPVKLMHETMTEWWTKNQPITNDAFHAALYSSKNAWRKKRDKAADTGTIAHSHIEKYIKTGALPPGKIAGEVRNCFDEFLRFEREHQPVWLATEVQVGADIAQKESPTKCQIQYAGILDALAEIKGVVTLVDFKTSGDIKDDYTIQLAGLCFALERMGLCVGGRAILHLPKDGPYEFRPIDSDINADITAFLAALNFYNHKNLFMGRVKSDKRAKSKKAA